ncbi:MAG: hypothetical protein LBB72_07760 [Spirochaetaceae bacterium]|jgi:hypothetical protein|nr:hypothetical protein [Spirochaetaceae bacterium]
MLDFVKKAFRNGIVVILWINLILSAIAGGIVGYYLGQLNGKAGEYAFLGVIIGSLCGLLTDIVGGGFITTILSIEKNTEEQTALLKKHLGINDISVDNQREGKNNESKKSDPVIPLPNNQIKIIRLKSVIGSALLADIRLDNQSFQLENGEEKIIKIENGKHIISASFNNDYDKLEFEINNNSKVFNVFIKPPIKIQET